MITITINGKDIKLDEPTSVLKAARKAGIKIPTLCHHDALETYGGCRLCVVEVERMPKLQNACTLMAADGMVVTTESEVIAKVRRGILELLLINHPLDCPYCDKAGECELQDLVDRYGPTVGRYTEVKRKVPASHKDEIFSRNMDRCVVCTRCVRMCSKVQGASAIEIIGRGNKSRMEPFSSDSFNCEYCGNCLSVCPVGAILSRLHLHSFRPWQIDKEVETVCSYCGVGCSVVAQVRDNTIKRVIPRFGLGLNNGLLCSRGRFGYEYINSEDRIQEPLIRKNGRLEKSSWSEAIEFTARKLAQIKKAHGGDSIAGIASPRCTNEDNYVFQKFMRMACGTNNIDSMSRMGFASAQRYMEDLLGQGVTSNMISGIKNADTILVVGGDPTAVNPILGLAVREAANNGAAVAVIGEAKGLEKFRTLKVVPPVFREPELLESILSEVSKARGPRNERPAVDQGISRLSGGASGADIEGLKKILLDGESVSIILGSDIVQRANGHRALFAVAGLVYILEARLTLLSDRPNEQGLIDMGCLPDTLPGGRPVSVHDFRDKFENEWNGTIPENEGSSLLETIDSAAKGKIKALYVMGENPAFNLPDSSSAKKAMESLDLLVVQDIFLTETAEMADVVFPSSGWSEKQGTYTNLERRVQLLNRAVTASSSMEDWKIIEEVSNKMGYQMSHSSAEEIMQEIAKVSPLYVDLTYREIGGGHCLWPYHGKPLRGEVSEVPVSDEAPADYKEDLYLALDKPLFHSGSLSGRSSALRKIYPEPLLRISSGQAQKLGLKNGDLVDVSTSKGGFNVLVSVDDSLSDGKVYLGNNFKGAGAMSLMGYELDPVTKAPGLEGCAIKIQKKAGSSAEVDRS